MTQNLIFTTSVTAAYAKTSLKLSEIDQIVANYCQNLHKNNINPAAARDLNVWGCCSVRHFRIRKIQAYCRLVSLLLFSIVHSITKTEANFNKFIKFFFVLGFRKHTKQVTMEKNIQQEQRKYFKNQLRNLSHES